MEFEWNLTLYFNVGQTKGSSSAVSAVISLVLEKPVSKCSTKVLGGTTDLNTIKSVVAPTGYKMSMVAPEPEIRGTAALNGPVRHSDVS